MPRVPALRRVFRLATRRAPLADDVDAELAFHFEQTTADLVARGHTPESARAEARRRFGDVDARRSELRAIDGVRERRRLRVEAWQTAWQDVRYAARSLRRRAGFSAAVVATLALGVGANATMFGIVDRLLLRPPAGLLAPDRTGRVYLTRTTAEGKDRTDDRTGYARFLDLRERTTTTLDALVAIITGDEIMGEGVAARTVRVTSASASLWRLFDTRPLLGRFYTDDEDRDPSGAHVVVLGHDLWRGAFGGDPRVLGRVVRIGAEHYTVVGVAPRHFTGAELTRVDAFVPIAPRVAAFEGRADYRTHYNISYLQLLARRRAGVSAARANAELTAAYGRSMLQVPNARPLTKSRPRAQLASILFARGPKSGQEVKVATWLTAVSLLVVLIACANVTNLALARTLGRGREVALRLALGAGRARLARQLAVESALLAAAGAAAGLAVAQWGGGALRALLVPDVVWAGGGATGRLLAYGGVAALVTGLLTALAPIVQANRAGLSGVLKSGTREAGVRRSWLRPALLVAQGALSVVLLVGAGLFVRSLQNVHAIALGFEPERVAYVGVDPRGAELTTDVSRELMRRLGERAAAVPGVERWALATTVPFYMGETTDDLHVDGVDSVAALGSFSIATVDGDYFATMGTRVLRGRPLGFADRAGAPLAVVVSESAARALWPGRDALGQCLRVGERTAPCSAVVGIAADLRDGEVGAPPTMHVYVPIPQRTGVGRRTVGLLVRLRGDPAAFAPTLHRALQPLAPGAAYVNVHPLDEFVAPQLRPWQLGATLCGVFGALALVLAAVGLYSVLAYDVAQRRAELGVRMAIGARARDVLRHVVGRGMRVTLVGIAIGLGVALAAGRFVVDLLFGVTPRDPVTLGTVAALLAAVALAAGLVPGWRAAHVAPTEALRGD